MAEHEFGALQEDLDHSKAFKSLQETAKKGVWSSGWSVTTWTLVGWARVRLGRRIEEDDLEVKSLSSLYQEMAKVGLKLAFKVFLKSFKCV